MALGYTALTHLLDLALIIGLGILFPLVHLANGWLFAFAELSPHVALIYLPAFLRLMNVLVLGRLKGTLATVLGVVLLLGTFPEHDGVEWVNIACSAAGPLLALMVFERWRQRPVVLTSLRDLTTVTLIYCLANALLHHLSWALMLPEPVGSLGDVASMVVGDLVGALLGAYLLKWVASRMRWPGQRLPPP